jgi:hypothetical protein
MQWHEAIPERWRHEKAVAEAVLNRFDARIDGDGRACISGVFDVYSEHGHLYESVELRIVYPPDFPARNQPPSVYLESHRDQWKKGGNSHIESDWKLCLFVPIESGIDFSAEFSLNHLFAIIHTFLFKQRIYQRRLAKTQLNGGIANWPGEDRAHGPEGVREAIREIGRIGRNASCPCGSGVKYKKCCMGKFRG